MVKEGNPEHARAAASRAEWVADAEPLDAGDSQAALCQLPERG
jgi:hypothetical protein